MRPTMPLYICVCEFVKGVKILFAIDKECLVRQTDVGWRGGGV